MIHERIVYTWWNLFSDFGGIIGIIMPVIFFINTPISYVSIMAQLIGKLYYHRPQGRTHNTQYNHVQKIVFRGMDLILNVKWFKPFIKCCKLSKRRL